MSCKNLSPHCEECGMFKSISNPNTPSFGYDNPEVICILPYPETQDDDGKIYEGPRAKMVRKALEPYEGRYLITYLVRCPTYKEQISRKYNPPSQKTIDICTNNLYDELKQYPNAKLMTFGSLVYQTLAKDPTAKISQLYGVRKKVTVRDIDFEVIPNYEPGYIERNQLNMKDFNSYIAKAFAPENTVSLEDRYEILTPQKSLELLERIRTMYTAGQIDHFVFDIENSISLEPIHGGEITMISAMVPGEDKAYTIPLVISNTVHHFKTYDDPVKKGTFTEQNLEDYKVKFPYNSQLITKDNRGFWVVPDLSYDVPPCPIVVTPQEKLQIRESIRLTLNMVPISGHNLKYDLKHCHFHGFCDLDKIQIWIDTMNVSVQLQGVGGGIDNSLKGLARRYFNITDNWEYEIDEYLEKFKRVDDRHYGQLPTSILGRYAALDVYYTHLLEIKFKAETLPQLLDAAKMIDAAIVPIVETELKGMNVCPKTYNFLKHSYTEFMEKKSHIIYQLPLVRQLMGEFLPEIEKDNSTRKKPWSREEINKKAFNLNYPAKVSKLMFDPLYYGLPFVTAQGEEFVTESGGPSGNKDCRAWLVKEVVSDRNLKMLEEAQHPGVDKLIEGRAFLDEFGGYKRMSKLLNDYIMAFPNSMHGQSYKPSFNLNGTITGRLSSPFHSMPNGCDIKRIITSRWASAGGLIMAADQSQLELRIVAALANEQSMITNFANGIDAHRSTGALVARIDPSQVTDKQRGVGKTVNFAVLYGKTAHNLSIDLQITVAEAEEILRKFYANVKNLLAWKTERENFALKHGYIDTMFGRRINIPSAFSSKIKDIEETKRLGVNYSVQSAASDIVLNTVVDIYYAVKAEALKSILLATVHDSIEYDVYPGELFRMAQLFYKWGEEEIPKLYPWVTCPLHLDMELGTSWGGAFKCKIESLDDTNLVFTTSALRKDLSMFVLDAKKAYNVEMEILKDDPFVNDKSDIFYTDSVIRKARISISAK